MSTLRTPPTAPEVLLNPPSGPGEPEAISLEREALAEVIRLVADRGHAEAEVARTRAAQDEAADRDYRERKQALDDRYAGLEAAERHEDATRRRAITEASIAGESAAKDEFAKASRKIASEFDAGREQARGDHAKGRARATADFDSAERHEAARYAEARKPIDDTARLIQSRSARLDELYQDYKHFGLPEAPGGAKQIRGGHKVDDPLNKVFDRLQKHEPYLALLEGLIIPKSMKGKRFIWLFVFLAPLTAIPLVMLAGFEIGLPVALLLTGVGGYLLKVQLYKLSATQVGKLYYPLSQTLVDSMALLEEARAAADEHHKADKKKNAEARDDALAKAKAKQAKAIADGEANRDERLRIINEVYAKRTTEIQTKLAREMREAVDLHDRRMEELPAQREASVRKLEEKYQALKDKIRAHHDTSWDAMATAWRDGMAAAGAKLDRVRHAVDAHAPRWDDPSWAGDRQGPQSVPPLFRIGETRVELRDLPGGLPADPRLMQGIESRLDLPALLPFPDRSNLLIEAPAAGRTAALGVLQSAMLRLLTSLPPGMIRFTIVDPVGIGRNFGAFMHLADFDEALVGGQVLTDARQIDERLLEISTHMEKITQKYLRDEYASIDEYNAVAGEVAEPYRILVVADFPAGFDEKSAARLAGISANGTPCGVLTLVSRDPDKPVPLGTDAEALRANASVLAWDGQKLNWSDPDFRKYPLVLDAPPTGEGTARLVRQAGASAKAAKRVEVPFEYIAPEPENWWKLDSRKGIDLPLGKAGATKRQNLMLGKGTSQHVIVAGRTGSGKSTLLHTLIVNAALNYSPDEVELYLIDFKKGVEFKIYATYNLPHAAVVAIESEREFGISVLQRLDAELRLRADRFRDAGVQDVNGYRNIPDSPPCPRILLVVDEFQEFFVEEDKLAQEATLLLDRLVRQGRAFGVHVTLGSQSLGGAYALARTTLGQIAIRIALQCSEADAHLVLSEQNGAAKLLSRPGEAIYNDANGAADGNNFFQVCYLSDEKREDYLRKIRELTYARKPVLNRTPIVFEGDAEAELSRNEALRPLLDAPGWPKSPRSSQAWLGDPVAIKEPTSVLFRRQGGNHLLILGQKAEQALGIMTASLIGLAAQYPPAKSSTVRDGAKFFVIDGTPEDDAQADYLDKIAGKLGHSIRVVGWRDAARVVAEVGDEVTRRQQPDADDGPEVFLLIHDLGRFRDLRRKENDFGFGSPGEPLIPADHLTNILKEGSALGVHLIAWSDTLVNLNRVFDNQAIREFESRVLFQVSATDSAHLLDSPVASKLGPNRALFASEEQNRLEKFRPYGLPSDQWLEQIRQRLGARNTP